MHQRNILIAAFDSIGSVSDFDIELTKLFGSPLTVLSADPISGDQTRRAWEPVASASDQKVRSQTEQRVVDVTLRDLLRIVHAMPLANKVGWRALLDELTASSQWDTVAGRIHAITGLHDEASGFFWSGMLAKALGATWATRHGPVAAADILSFGSNSTSAFGQARHPRAGSGNTVKVIKEMGDPAARAVASDVLAQALGGSSMRVREKLTVTAVVGAVISADLWRHPSAVRYLLLAAVKLLRKGGPGTFSLDSPSRRTEIIIKEELGDKWDERHVW